MTESNGNGTRVGTDRVKQGLAQMLSGCEAFLNRRPHLALKLPCLIRVESSLITTSLSSWKARSDIFALYPYTPTMLLVPDLAHSLLVHMSPYMSCPPFDRWT
jgi:hypothetical protein